MQSPLVFSAAAITGSGRGREYGIPTINVNLAEVPEELADGIYACMVSLPSNDTKYLGAMHYGARPVFNDSRACEVHIIDEQLASLPPTIEISVVERLRDIANFDSVEELKQQIEHDIEQCRAILGAI